MIKDLPNSARIMRIYSGMKSRCYNEKMPNYAYYGERGILVCEEWKNNFQAFYDWAISNGYADDLTIDRIDVNGNYEPSNCRWATAKEQGNNRSNNVNIEFDYQIHTIPEWSEIIGIKQYVIRNRLKRGWSIEEALTRKVGKYVYQD